MPFQDRDDEDYSRVRLAPNGALRTDPTQEPEPCGAFFVGFAFGAAASCIVWFFIWWLL